MGRTATAVEGNTSVRYPYSGIADPADVSGEQFPQLDTLAAGFLYQFLPRPQHPEPPEFVYVPVARGDSEALHLYLAQWNCAWEAAQLRHDVVERPADLPAWLRRFKDRNLCLLPFDHESRYQAYAPLCHLLPHHALQRHGLPLVKRGWWPPVRHDFRLQELLPGNSDERLGAAFAQHVWPLLDSGSGLAAFSASEPLCVLAHNLDFWLPYADQVVRERVSTRKSRVPCDDPVQERRLRRVRKQVPPGVRVDRPLTGGTVWFGADEAWEATQQLVDVADRDGHLRGLVDAIRSNRVEEDFSARWSFAREDFERKLYHKRSRVKVSFVELNETVPVHGPHSEVEENVLWEDFLALLDAKERRIVVCLRNGVTRVGEIGAALGYANHSPVSKALGKIRRKAKTLLDLD